MIKSALVALLTTAATLGAGSADAGGVSWSIGINTPVLGSVITNAPYAPYASYSAPYYDAPYYAPAYGPVYAPVPVYESGPVYAPVPVYRAQPRVAYYPRPIYYGPAPVVYPRGYPGWRHGDRRDRMHGRDRDRDGHRWNERR